MNIRIVTTAALALILLAGAAAAQNIKLNGEEATGVNNRRGNPSPTAGFSTGEANSRIDDYFNQDEQINIAPDSGVVKVLRVNQKNLINDFVSALFPLNNATPRELRNVMRVVTGKEGGRAEVIRDKLTGENWLQVIAPKFMLPWIEEAVAQLDVTWLAQARDGSIEGRYQALWRNSRSIDFFASFWAGEGATFFDDNNNMILRRDEPYRVESYMKAARLFDKPAPMALLKFKIYEVDTSNDLKLGVDWIAWKNGPGRSLFDVLYASQDAHHRYENASGFFDPYLGAATLTNPGSNSFHVESTQYLLSANYLLTTAYLDFMRVKGKARVMAEPEIFVKSAELGIWLSTDQFLTFDVEPEDPGALGIVPKRLNKTGDFAVHNRFLNHNLGPKNQVGVKLEVFPVVGKESSEVEVLLEVSELAGTTPQGTAILTTRKLVSKARLVSGQPFVFGGLTREEDVEASNKAPWLGDIPVLGYLFGQETTSKRRKELVITVVPQFFQTDAIPDPQSVETIAMARGEQEIPLPENSFGFDQYLFDCVEHP